jgi:hypothetical protein
MESSCACMKRVCIVALHLHVTLPHAHASYVSQLLRNHLRNLP